MPSNETYLASTQHPTGKLARKLLIEKPTRQEPTFWQKVASYAADTLKHVRNGLQVTPPAVEKIRLEMCQSCPTNDYDAGKQSCKQCGCKAQGATWLTNKLKRASSECPKKHWLAYKPSKVDFWLHWFRTGAAFPEGLEMPPEAEEARRIVEAEQRQFGPIQQHGQ